ASGSCYWRPAEWKRVWTPWSAPTTSSPPVRRSSTTTGSPWSAWVTSKRPDYQRVKDRLAELAVAFPEPVRTAAEEESPVQEDVPSVQNLGEAAPGAR